MSLIESLRVFSLATRPLDNEAQASTILVAARNSDSLDGLRVLADGDETSVDVLSLVLKQLGPRVCELVDLVEQLLGHRNSFARHNAVLAVLNSGDECPPELLAHALGKLGDERSVQFAAFRLLVRTSSSRLHRALPLLEGSLNTVVSAVAHREYEKWQVFSNSDDKVLQLGSAALVFLSGDRELRKFFDPDEYREFFAFAIVLPVASGGENS
jgi:HEAT repeat protein